MSIFSENMSEDKAIKVLDNYLQGTYNKFTRCGAVGIPDEQWYAIDRILDLYKAEKEKNKKIKEYIEQCDWHDDDVYIGEDILELLEE